MMEINKKKHKVKKENYYNTKQPKIQIVISLSLRSDSNHIIRLNHKDYGKTKKWNTYTISRDGTIYEHFNPENHSDFLGIKEADKNIISIVLENMGGLIKKDEDFINWINEKCPKEMVLKKKFLGVEYWESFTNDQIMSASYLCRFICDKFNIPSVMVNFHHHNKNINKFSGIVFKSNYFEDSSDINPFFNTEKFNTLLEL